MIDNIRLEIRTMKHKEVIIHLIDGSRRHISGSINWKKIIEKLNRTRRKSFFISAVLN